MLQLNQRIELEVKSGDYAGNYLSRVEEIGENDIRIAIPVEKGTIIPLRLKTPVTVTIVGKDAVYSANTFIIGRFNDSLPLLVLLKPAEFRRIQRRNYVRIDANLPTQIKVVNESEEDENIIPAHSRNISGGGMMLTVENQNLGAVKISIGTILDIAVEIPDIYEPVKAIGRVVRSDRQKSASGTEELIIGVNFTALEEKDREDIISYVFRRQRELRKLGLL